MKTCCGKFHVVVTWRYKVINMKEIRFLMEDALYKDLRIICIKNDLSVPKQLTSIVKNFIEIMQSNEKRLEHTKRK